ncbi:MAG: hypothetical protein ACRDRH_09175 [Pseudonocardia sp.]
MSDRLVIWWCTSVRDGYSHAVTDDAFGWGVRKRQGEFETMCGLVIYLTALTAPCGRPCARCAAFPQARPLPPAAPGGTGMLRRCLGLLRWILGRPAPKSSP